MCSDDDAVGSEELPKTEVNVAVGSAGARIALDYGAEAMTCVAADSYG